jgi:hypothetical protein
LNARALALALALLLLSGCVETRLYSGLPPGDPPLGYRGRWHVSYLLGTTEGSGPYELDRLCPDGWSEITLNADFFTSVAQMMTLFLYTPNRLTIVCARPIELDAPRLDLSDEKP